MPLDYVHAAEAESGFGQFHAAEAESGFGQFAAWRGASLRIRGEHSIRNG